MLTYSQLDASEQNIENWINTKKKSSQNDNYFYKKKILHIFSAKRGWLFHLKVLNRINTSATCAGRCFQHFINALIENPLNTKLFALQLRQTLITWYFCNVKKPKLCVTCFERGIHHWQVDSTHTNVVTRKMFPFNDVIMLGPYSAPDQLTPSASYNKACPLAKSK